MLNYAKGARVLDVFAYLGAWGLAAARAGAREVLCVDSSARGTRRCSQESAAANDLAACARCATMPSMRSRRCARRARSSTSSSSIRRPSSSASATCRRDIAAYRKLNQVAMQLLSRDGILVPCSCSHHLPHEELVAAVQQSARHLSRFAQIIEVGGHAPDHPIHPAIPETRYLKTLTCRVVHD